MKRKKHTRRGTQHRAYPIKWIITAIIIIVSILIYQQDQQLIVCLDAGHGGHDARLSFCQWQTI